MITHSCMGGWCSLREHCRYYHAATPEAHPSERLCIPGEDGKSDVVFVQLRRCVKPLPSQLEAA